MKKTILKALPKELDVIFVNENSRMPKVLRTHLNHLKMRRRCQHDSQLAIIFYFKEGYFTQETASTIDSTLDTMKSEEASSPSEKNEVGSISSSGSDTIAGASKNTNDIVLAPIPTTSTYTDRNRNFFQAAHSQKNDLIEQSIDAQSQKAIDTSLKRTTTSSLKTKTTTGGFKDKNNLSESQYPETNIYTSTISNISRAPHDETNVLIQPVVDHFVSPIYAYDSLSKPGESGFVSPHSALIARTEFDATDFGLQCHKALHFSDERNSTSSKTDKTAASLKETENIVVSEHLTTADNCFDTNSNRFEAAHQQIDDFVEKILNRFISPNHETYDVVNAKDDNFSKPNQSPSGLIGKNNISGLSGGTACDIEENNVENVNASSEIGELLKEIKMNYDLTIGGISKRIDEQQRILNDLIKEKNNAETRFYDALEKKCSQWIKKKTSRGKKKRIGQLKIKIR
ncbi:unnamed protein product [Rotaria socialis]|uniref:Uncharacterized protein n=1 Tax=Rotaria socialis TaxID=392032 RepID=A0A820ZM76_9BILA|nr:unnamed protein product [Rotaria socialis]